jgi:hypothetical protein
MKQLLLFVFTICLVKSHAQKNIEGLIRAEKNFAAYSVDHGTKAAFLKFLDSNGIVFNQGKPANGIEVWIKREDRPGVLNWYPTRAEIAGSGDFGYTTGPFTLRIPGTDSVVARGQYSTVWHLTRNGEWKFLVDLGVGNTPSEEDTTIQRMGAHLKTKTGSLATMLKAENDFIQDLKVSVQEAYEKYLSGEARLNRNGLAPQERNFDANSYQQQKNTLILGSGIAPSLDLGYVFGSTTINGKTDNYMRIWRLEKEGWKMVLEVLRS